MPRHTSAAPPLSATKIRDLRFSTIFASPTGSTNAPLATQLRKITHTLLAVQSQHLDAALLSYWLRLPSPRPSRTRLVSLFTHPHHPTSLTRIWANRVTLQYVCNADVWYLREAVRTRVLARCVSMLKHCSHGEAALVVYEMVCEKVRERLVEGCVLDSRDVDAMVESALRGYVGVGGVVEGGVVHCVRSAVFVWATVVGVAERVVREGVGGRVCVAAVGGGKGGRVRGGEAEGVLWCARRYFGAYGPCGEGDFRYWMGITAAESNKAVGALVDEGFLEEVEVEGGGVMFMVRGGGGRSVERGVRFVGRFEPLLLAHKDKSWIVGERERKRVWNRHSEVAACVLKDGRIRGVWKRQGKGISVRLFADGLQEFGNGDLAEVLEKGREIVQGFYATDGEVVVEREAEDGQVHVVRQSDVQVQGDGEGKHDEQQNCRYRLRKRRRRS